MSEENNRKGPGVFYAVVGVATLVVAIIGATFAFFSAQATATGEAITGGTNDDLASALAVDVHQVLFSEIPETVKHELVPAVFDNTPANLKAADIEAAIKNKCVNAGYTGCHIWKIDVGTKQELAEANVILNLSVTADKKDNWSYAVFQADTLTEAGTSTNVTVPTLADGKAVGTIGEGVTALDIHGAKKLSKTEWAVSGADTNTSMTNPSVTYYVMVYLANVASSQNPETNSETGTYNGSVVFKAAGGEVKATFTASV